MKLGLLSDTHGNVPRTRMACEVLLSRGVEAVIHCGDIGAELVLVELAAHFAPAHVPVYAVTGNVDRDDACIAAFPEAAGVSIMGRVAKLTLGGKNVTVVHGDDERELRRIVSAGGVDYVCVGHSHKADDTREGATRIINPGALHRSGKPGVAVLDLADGRLEFIPVEDPRA